MIKTYVLIIKNTIRYTVFFGLQCVLSSSGINLAASQPYSYLYLSLRNKSFAVVLSCFIKTLAVSRRVEGFIAPCKDCCFINEAAQIKIFRFDTPLVPLHRLVDCCTGPA